jgi:hypothetical protein
MDFSSTNIGVLQVAPWKTKPGEPQISHFLNNRTGINGEIPPQRLLAERTEIPSSISNKPGKLN